jgi:predicted metal-dependent peptidase
MPENLEAAQKLAAARLLAVHLRPYFSAALYALVPRETKEVGTMAVDRWWRLYYCPGFVTEHTVEELAGVLFHEVSHVLRDHNQRCELHGFEHLRWNVAADMEINDDLEAERVKLPGGLYPRSFNLKDGLLAEEYYGQLEKFVVKVRIPMPGSGKCGSGAGGESGPWEEGPPGGSGTAAGISPGEGEIIRGQVAERIIEEASRSRGTVPAGWKRWAEARLKPQISWKKELAALIRSGVAYASGAVDFSYQRPSRRQSALPRVVLPRLIRPVPSVAVVIDTSGSMADFQIAQALAEVGGILKAMGQSEGVRVMSCDAAASRAKQVFRPEQVDIIGGGGTDMRVGIEESLKLKPRPHVVVVITDGYTPWPEHPPRNVKVVVCLCGEGASPAWARTVKVELEDKDSSSRGRRMRGFPLPGRLKDP